MDSQRLQRMRDLLTLKESGESTRCAGAPMPEHSCWKSTRSDGSSYGFLFHEHYSSVAQENQNIVEMFENLSPFEVFE